MQEDQVGEEVIYIYFLPLLAMVLGSLPFRARYDVRTNEVTNYWTPTPTRRPLHMTVHLAIAALGRVHHHDPGDRGGSPIDRRRADGYATP
jgi:hypothetical protein